MGVLRNHQDKNFTGLPLAERCPPSQARVCSASVDTKVEERQDISPCKGAPFLGQRLLSYLLLPDCREEKNPECELLGLDEQRQ